MFVVEIEPGSEGAQEGVNIAGLYGPFYSRGAAEQWGRGRIKNGSHMILELHEPGELPQGIPEQLQ